MRPDKIIYHIPFEIQNNPYWERAKKYVTIDMYEHARPPPTAHPASSRYLLTIIFFLPSATRLFLFLLIPLSALCSSSAPLRKDATARCAAEW